MKFRVEISPSAVADASAAYGYIRLEAPLAAARWYDSLLELIDGLAEMPRRHAYAREHGLVPGELRQALHPPYRVIFSVAPGVVMIHHIRHAARDRLKRAEARRVLRPEPRRPDEESLRTRGKGSRI